MTDDVMQTPVQLKKWFVFYESPAEGLLVYKGLSNQESVAEGQLWQSTYGFTNISSRLFTDSLTVKFEVFNDSKSILDVTSFKVASPLPGDTAFFDVTTNTVGKSGLNDLLVFVNPRIIAEQYYDNNVIELGNHLNVIADITPPVLDVTIDGRYVRNGDFVSTSPTILISVVDENQFLLMQDTTSVVLFVARECGTLPCLQPIYFSNPDLTWTPADPQQPFQVEYLPQLDTGHYTLLVQAMDASGNLSGDDFYSVSFVVSDEENIVLFPPYPNPTSGKVIFKFQVAGDEVPDEFALQIISLDGRTVQHYDLTSDQFQSGINYFEWNARDSIGNLLPNGLYIYKTIISSGGQVITQTGRIVIVN